MPKITLNGKELEFESGQTVIEVAREDGIDVPHYCWHPALSVVASCRICQVEVHGPGPKRLATSCNLECVDGMVIKTESPEVSKARAGNLEALLLNHPLDCPICDKAGECWLQDYAYEYGAAASRSDFPRRKLEKRVDISEHVLLDQERCILCTRCVRFLDDYVGKPELVVTERGEQSVLETFPGHPVENDYQGNLADICPVGALTLKEFRFKNRVWYLKGTDSVCPSCSRGCSITLDVRDDELNRVRPRTNLDVNGYFICDTGRFGLHEKYHPEHRIEKLMANGEGASLETAGHAAAILFQEAARSGDILVLASPDATNEELFLLKSVFSQAPAPISERTTLAFLKAPENAGDDILQTGQCAANVAGLRNLGFEELDDAALKERTAAAQALFVLDDRLSDLNQARLVLQARTSPLASSAAIVLPGSTLAEKEGSVTNFENRTQRVRPAMKTPRGIPGDFACLLALGEALGISDLPRTPGEAFMAFADSQGQSEATLAGLHRDGAVLSSAVTTGRKTDA